MIRMTTITTTMLAMLVRNDVVTNRQQHRLPPLPMQSPTNDAISLRAGIFKKCILNFRLLTERNIAMKALHNHSRWPGHTTLDGIVVLWFRFRFRSMLIVWLVRLIVSALDAMRVFDVPNATLVGQSSRSRKVLKYKVNKTIMSIDWFRCESVVIGIAFSPLDDFIATIHAGHRAIYLWFYFWFWLFWLFF